MSENNSNPTVDDNITKEKELLMGDNVHNAIEDDNEVQVAHHNEEIKEDKDKLVDINVNEIQDVENKPEQVPTVDDIKNDGALANQNLKEVENKDDGSSLEKQVDEISDENKLASVEADQMLNCNPEQHDNNSQPILLVPEESKTICDNGEFSTSNENTQIEKTETEKVSTLEEIEKDLPSEKLSNEDVQDTISTEQSLIGDNLHSQNKESNQEINNSNLLNLTDEGVEDETLLIRGLAASEEADKLKDQQQVSVEENSSSSNQLLSPTIVELGDAVASTPLTQHQLLEDPLVENQPTSENLINVDSLAEGQYLITTKDDKSLDTGVEELTASQPEESSSQLVEPLSSQTEELISIQSEEHLAPESKELCESNSEDRAVDLPEDLDERIASNKDRLDSTEKSNASQDNRFESSPDTQETREEDQSSNAFSQIPTSDEEINMHEEESNTSNVSANVNEESISNNIQSQSPINQRESILEDDIDIELDQKTNNAAYQVTEEERNEQTEEKLPSFEEKLPENTDCSVSDSVKEESLIPQETENSSTDKLTSCERDEENIDSTKEFAGENTNDPEPVIEELSKNQIELEESMPQSYGTNEYEDFVEVEESKLLASSAQEEIDNLENEEKFECYDEAEEASSHCNDVSANPNQKLNVESVQTRLTDSEHVDTNVGVSENLLEYTEEVATNILQSSREEIARKSTRSFWSKEYQELLKKNLSSLPSLIFFSFIFFSGVLGSALEMSILPFALFNVVAFLSIFLIYKCFLSC